MKKFFTLAAIAAVVASMSLTACGPSSPEDFAKKQVELENEAAQAKKDGDEDKFKEIQDEAKELQKELDAKCKEDPEFKAAYYKAYAAEKAK